MSKSLSPLSKLLRLIVLVAVLAGVIYFIVRKIDTIGNVFLVLLGFGAVILVHEFGHFICAKLSSIKVEAFSIGFPPTLLGFQRTERGLRVRILPGFFQAKQNDSDQQNGSDQPDASLLSFTVGRPSKPWETEYCVGLIPIGGYVKMLGQEDTGPAKSTDDPRSFANRPVGVRAAVIAAGVAFNVIAAIAIFVIVFLVGIERPPAVVGGVEPDSPAAHAGLMPGDEIIQINGKSKDLDFTDIMIAAALSGRDEPVSLKVQRDGSEHEVSLIASQRNGGQLKTFGIAMPETLTVDKLAKQKNVNDLLAKTNLAPGDRIISVDGKEVDSHWAMADLVQNSLAPTVKLLAERTVKNRQIQPVDGHVRLRWTFANSYQADSESELHHVCSMVPRLRVTAYTEMPKPESLLVRVGKKIAASAESLSRKIASLVGIAWKQKKKPEKRRALRQGDIILSVGDFQNPTYSQMRQVVQANKDKPVSVTVLRADDSGVGQPVTDTVVPRRLPGLDRVQIGAALELDADHPVVANTIETGQGPAKLDIPLGAVITAVDGAPVSSFYDVVTEIKKYPGERITIDYRLDEETAGAVVVNVGEPEETITVKSAVAESIPFEMLKSTYRADGPVHAVLMGYRKTTALIAQTYLTIRRLIGGIVSPKELMGPVGILSVSYDVVAEKMWIEYLFLIGLINAAIAVFNFLPLPPLDGGLFAFLMVEKIKGSAISERAQGLVIRAGWVLVLALFLYITFNDVVRNFFS